MEIIVLVIGALLAGLGWLYQKTWERQDARIKSYQVIIDSLPSFVVGRFDSENVNIRNANEMIVEEAQSEYRRLWLFAPDSVVRAGHAFFASTVEGELPSLNREATLQNFVLEMRKDSSFQSAVLPRFFTTKLSSDIFKLITVKPSKSSSRA